MVRLALRVIQEILVRAEKMEPQESRGRLEGQVEEVPLETEEKRALWDLEDPSEILDVMDLRVYRENPVDKEQLGSLAFPELPGPQG